MYAIIALYGMHKINVWNIIHVHSAWGVKQGFCWVRETAEKKDVEKLLLLSAGTSVAISLLNVMVQKGTRLNSCLNSRL